MIIELRQRTIDTKVYRECKLYSRLIKRKTMAAHTKENPKKVQTYRAEPKLILKAKKKAAKQNTTLSEKINELVTDWVEN